MKHLEYWLWGQIALEAVLVGVVAWYLLRLRHFSRSLSGLSGPDNPAVAALATLEQRLTAMETRLAQLEAAAPGLEDRHLAAPEASGGWPSGARSPDPGSGASLRTQVEELSRQGLRPEEIARRLGLRPAEVKVALELARLRPA